MRKTKAPSPERLLPVLALGLLAAVAGAREVAIPEPLRPWKAWVEARNPDASCPTHAAADRVCVAYGSLDLDLGDRGGAFTQAVAVYGRQWVILPGGGEIWPLEVQARGGAPVAVVLRDGLPQVRLEPGEHLLGGKLAWSGMPGALGIPPRAARVSLKLRGKAVASPEKAGGGRLLLEGKGAKPDSTASEVPLTLRVYRKLIDDIPMRLVTRISLAVSGAEREIVTGRVLPEGVTPMEIQSDLPVRVEAGGRLRAQLLPGDRTVTVISRFLEPVAAVAMERLDSLWPEEEIWTFEARRDIRVVELAGAPLIDPSQTGLPDDWKSLPAYRLAPGDSLRLVEKQRGDSSPQAGSLRLNRRMWLDFSGKGFTQKDAIQGRLFRRSRLEMRPGFELGRADLNGSPVMITASDSGAGVEVPAGDLSMVALSRAPRKGGSHEATGWNQGFQGMETTLNLPPGWRLIHAGGPDRVSNSWVSGWSLWEVFLLCILTLAVFKLAGWGGSALAFATFVLLSQEQGLDGLLWLNLMAAIGLCRVLPRGRLSRAVHLYRWASLVILVVLWIPFAIVQARKALYPQLDEPGTSAYGYDNRSVLEPRNRFGENREAPVSLMMMEDMGEPAQSQAPQTEADHVEEQKARILGLRPSRSSAGGKTYRSRDMSNQVMQYARVQTGPGEPIWGWEIAHLSWSGPVGVAESLDLLLMPPWLTRLFRALQALLPAGLLFLLAFRTGLPPLPGNGGPGKPGATGGPGRSGSGSRWTGFGKAAAAAIGLVPSGAAGFLALGILSVTPARAQFPDEALLKELETRLAAPPDCSPGCASLNAGIIALSGDRFRISLFFDAADTAVALLPDAGQDQWSLEAIRIGERPAASALRLATGALAAVLPKGRSRVTLEGRLLGDRLELVFGEATHNLAVEAPSFAVQGLAGGRAESGTLVFQRREKAAGPAEARRALSPDPVLPFVEVHRTLDLGQEWILDTRVVRVAPHAGAFSIEVPLLPFEHPLSAAMSRDREKTLVSFQEGQGEAAWRSTLDRKEVLALSSGSLAHRAEVWYVQATPRWHLETWGLAPAQGQPDMGPVTLWRPIPGDTLRIRITEPQAASGPVKTIENADLSFHPGKREGSGSLTLSYRAGQGDAGKVTLPEGATLDNLRVNGDPQPMTQREGTLSLPLQPGLQTIELGWKQVGGIRVLQKSPRLTSGDAAANVAVELTVPGDRWVLLVGGPAAGPALLLWGVLAVLGLLGFALGRARVTPLGSLDWILLFIGTSTINAYAAAPLLVLFLALRWRERKAAQLAPVHHNLLQVVLAWLALIAFGTLVASVPQGLLSAPDMQITGNGSSSGLLRWFLDRTDGQLPVGWMLSVPLWVYRVSMLAWSLWLAFRLLKWLRWSWDRFSAGGLWRENPKPSKAPISPMPARPAAPGPEASGIPPT